MIKAYTLLHGIRKWAIIPSNARVHGALLQAQGPFQIMMEQALIVLHSQWELPRCPVSFQSSNPRSYKIRKTQQQIKKKEKELEQRQDIPIIPI